MQKRSARNRVQHDTGILFRCCITALALAAGPVAAQTFGHLAGQERAIYYATSVADATVTLSDGRTLEGEGVTPDELLLPSSQDLLPAGSSSFPRSGACRSCNHG